jgi:NADP-dependent 3-hydroxy acid dehydrogenase YdfG
MGTLEGKVAWITGAGSGIGRAGAEALAAAGATVVLSGRRAAQLDAVAEGIVGHGGTVEVEPLDVADKQAVGKAADRIIGRNRRVDILVNSAGLNLPKRHFNDVSLEGFEHLVQVNLVGMFYCMQAVLPTMRSHKDGLIINISSWAGRYDTYMTGPAYNATKHAVVSLTNSLNIEECMNGIRGCCICPGEAATEIMKNRPVPPLAEDMAKMLQADDLGRTIRFVAEMPPHACVNEIVISPTWNRIVLGASDIARR